ncbi:hypothetical protein PTTG_06305 [Puccinia triticina 1-1 BBBD Race 1]|uniref:Uncharacterized protein n=1 Tax=Puccinia triticina (isolate 1-1 / race 1 (BBBD)) TaxID=630390 RepID=A0A180GU69_PUCT1|nr:hypothetical protein PTTG_06305 [Puccinia triticina 1-1 BBBD Race 1]
MSSPTENEIEIEIELENELEQTYHAIHQLIHSTLSPTIPNTPRLSTEFQPNSFTNHNPHLSIQSSLTELSPTTSTTPTTNSESTSSIHQQHPQTDHQLCLTPTTKTSFDKQSNRSTRTMSLSIPPTATIQPNLTHLRHRSIRPSLTIQPDLTPEPSDPPILSAPANTTSNPQQINNNNNNNNIKKQPKNKTKKTESSTTSHFTRSLLPSKTPAGPLGRSSKFSLATVNTNGLILVPSATGKPVAAPITNLSMMPLYLVQPFLSPNPSTATSASHPNTPFARLSLQQQSSAFARFFPERSSFPITPVIPSPRHHHHHHHQHQPPNPLIHFLHKLLLFLAHPPTHRIASTPTACISEEKQKPKQNKKKTSIKTTQIVARLMGAFNKRTPQQPKLLTQAEKTVVLSDHYCCFAIPLYNTGIYSILAQFTVFGFVFGILSFSAPSILAIVLDFAYTAFFGILCLAVGFIQALGFFGVYKEKPAIFKKYFIGNVGLLALTFGYSLVLLIISSTKHATAIDQCLLQFVSNEEFVDGPSSTSRQVCSVWTYAQLAVCFFVWFLFFFSQLYFCYMVKIWGQDQKLDHIRYQSLISAVRQSRATSSMVHPGQLEGGDEWESRSTGGSLDIRSSMASGGQRAKPLANGGSRLKNEIEWKELPNAHPLDPSAAASSEPGPGIDKQKSREFGQSDFRPLLAQRDPTVSGHWIEVIDHPFPLPPSDPSHKHSPTDDQEFYKS